MIAGDRKSCNANKISISVRPPLCHSREGGNPYSTSLRGELASLGDSYPAHAQWIPAFAGMTNRISPLTLSAGMPVEAVARGQRRASAYPVSMRLSRHAWPRSRLGAAPSNGKQNVGWVEERNPTSLRHRKPVGVRSSPQPTALILTPDRSVVSGSARYSATSS